MGNIHEGDYLTSIYMHMVSHNDRPPAETTLQSIWSQKNVTRVLQEKMGKITNRSERLYAQVEYVASLLLQDPNKLGVNKGVLKEIARRICKTPTFAALPFLTRIKLRMLKTRSSLGEKITPAKKRAVIFKEFCASARAIPTSNPKNKPLEDFLALEQDVTNAIKEGDISLLATIQENMVVKGNKQAADIVGSLIGASIQDLVDPVLHSCNAVLSTMQPEQKPRAEPEVRAKNVPSDKIQEKPPVPVESKASNIQPEAKPSAAPKTSAKTVVPDKLQEELNSHIDSLCNVFPGTPRSRVEECIQSDLLPALEGNKAELNRLLDLVIKNELGGDEKWLADPEKYRFINFIMTQNCCIPFWINPLSTLQTLCIQLILRHNLQSYRDSLGKTNQNKRIDLNSGIIVHNVPDNNLGIGSFADILKGQTRTNYTSIKDLKLDDPRYSIKAIRIKFKEWET